MAAADSLPIPEPGLLPPVKDGHTPLDPDLRLNRAFLKKGDEPGLPLPRVLAAATGGGLLLAGILSVIGGVTGWFMGLAVGILFGCFISLNNHSKERSPTNGR
jgi:uncharacterized membrane protein YphA (DoxX/SURF4 family)